MIQDDILTIEDVSRALKVSKRTVYRWIDSGNLKVARISRKTYRIFESDLDDFIRQHIV